MKIPQLRVCVTEICDKKCFYCRPEGEGCASIERESKLSADDFIFLINEIVNAGVSIIRFTGGEPMLNKDIYKIINAVHRMKNVKDVSIVTRSLKLKEQAPLLKEAGINSITVSLDSLNRDKLKEITKVDLLEKLVDGIKACSEIDLPVKLNTVIMKGVNENEIEDFIQFAGSVKNVDWKLLDYILLPKQFLTDNDNKYFFDLTNLLPRLRELSEEEFIETQAGGLGIPMPTFKMKNGVIVSVKNSTIGNHYGDTCINCSHFPCQDGIMALRLTADGKLQRCLYREDNLIDLKPLLYTDNPRLRSSINEALDTFKKSVFHPNAWSPHIREPIFAY
ncbi:MAG TPA: radical SAM protein [Saprospiraceae bacterium]|nr:radical SAM protein [Saprospiraceae bacterium]